MKYQSGVLKFLYILISLLVVIMFLLVPCILLGVYERMVIELLIRGGIASGFTLSDSDKLSLFGSSISAMGTFALTICAYFQTKRANKKSDEVNALSLELQQQMFELAKSQMEYEKNKEISEQHFNPPDFEVKIIGYNGYYSNLRIEVKNTSNGIVKSLNGIDLLIYDENGIVFVKGDGRPYRAQKIEFQKRSLSSMESTVVETDSPEMRRIINTNKFENVEFFKKVKYVMKFSCTDDRGQRHYYEASITIPDTKYSHQEYWNCKIVG